ncbi:MAG: hypothetical protein AAF570_23470, partial [Bacteroidota bacterium]
MKYFVLLALAFCFPMFVSAQAPTLSYYANAELQESVVEVAQYNRITLLIKDGKPRNQGYVYEFGPLKVYQNVDGERVCVKTLKEPEVMNGPVLNFGLGPKVNADL